VVLVLRFRPDRELLITLDPASIGQPDANPKPIAWTHDVDGGRVFYTTMGHTIESYSDPLFLAHLAGGIRSALDRP
jgi:type 1 glutamine amidotransferase